MIPQGQSCLSFLNFSVQCHLLDSSLEIVDDQPLMLYRIKIVKTFLTANNQSTTETHIVNLQKKILYLFYEQLCEYFGSSKHILPDFNWNFSQSDSRRTPYSGGMHENHEDEGEGMVDFLNQVLKKEKALFCPLLRCFLNFDKSKKDDVRGSGDEVQPTTLNVRRTLSLKRNDLYFDDTGTEYTNLLGNLRKSFLYYEDEEIKRQESDVVKNFDLILKSNYIGNPNQAISKGTEDSYEEPKMLLNIKK